MYDMAENKPMVSGSTSLPPLHPRTPLPIPGPPPYTCRMPFALCPALGISIGQDPADRSMHRAWKKKVWCGVVWCGMVCICMAVPIPRCIKPARMMPLCVCMHRSFYACKYIVCTYAQSTYVVHMYVCMSMLQPCVIQCRQDVGNGIGTNK